MDRQVRVTAAGIARLSFIFEKFGRPSDGADNPIRKSLGKIRDFGNGR
jgi:hypothetical protein